MEQVHWGSWVFTVDDFSLEDWRRLKDLARNPLGRTTIAQIVLHYKGPDKKWTRRLMTLALPHGCVIEFIVPCEEPPEDRPRGKIVRWTEKPVVVVQDSDGVVRSPAVTQEEIEDAAVLQRELDGDS